jgi:hypothetical protein
MHDLDDSVITHVGLLQADRRRREQVGDSSCAKQQWRERAVATLTPRQYAVPAEQTCCVV